VLAGCTTNIRQMEQAEAIGGTPFTRALTEEYRALVSYEKDRGDWEAANHFAVKGLAAASGQIVLPEAVLEKGAYAATLNRARSRLITNFDYNYGREGTPQTAARAQRAFDCWQYEAARLRGDAIPSARLAACRDEFEAAMNELRVVIVDPPFAYTYLVFFDADSADLNEAGRKVVEQVLSWVRTHGSSAISATGHTDTSGPEDYNKALSLRRADAVRAALIAGGIDPITVTIASRGEEEQAVPTPDGVKKAANRRVEVVVGN